MLKPDFLQTQIADDGLRITCFYGEPVTIPWKSVGCVDVSGLTVLIKGSKPFFLMMVEDQDLIKKVCSRTSQKKVWFAAQNVLGVTSIRQESANSVQNEFQRLAQNNTIKLDKIWLPGF